MYIAIIRVKRVKKGRKKVEKCKKELTNIKWKYSMKNGLVRYRGEGGCCNDRFSYAYIAGDR